MRPVCLYFLTPWIAFRGVMLSIRFAQTYLQPTGRTQVLSFTDDRRGASINFTVVEVEPSLS